MTRQSVRFAQTESVDFVVIGSGAAGGVIAKELSMQGFSVVVLEQGPYIRPSELHHDEIRSYLGDGLLGRLSDHPHSWRTGADEPARPASFIPNLLYAKAVGGSSLHFAANYWRFRPVDFDERSRLGPVAGSTLADWPLTYDELEPYYTRVEWEIGVSGEPGPDDARRSRPYPMPAMPIKSSGVLLRDGARRAGYTSQPAPLAILSRPHNGRPPCIHCGLCWGQTCEVGAKSSTLAAMIPLAEASGRCEIRDRSVVTRIETNAAGRVERVVYLDREGVERAQQARAVVLSANGAETPRLLFLSESSRFPDGLANSSGLVGKNLMFNGYSQTGATFAEPLNEYKSVVATRIVMDFYDSDPARGFYGGGGIDARSSGSPFLWAVLDHPRPGQPSWGPVFKAQLASYPRSMIAAGHATSLPVETNTITLDPELVDAWGRPGIRVTYWDHPDDLAFSSFLQDRAVEMMEAAGATEVWRYPVGPSTASAHLLGTCRMGDDPGAAVVNRYHRAHDVPNLFICDGSSLVTSGRGQPTMTIQALAFRAAEHIGRAARAGEI
ncbi:MAG: GMC family oxidoreductase [Gemmatimonadota bacterium]